MGGRNNGRKEGKSSARKKEKGKENLVLFAFRLVQYFELMCPFVAARRHGWCVGCKRDSKCEATYRHAR